MNIARMMLEGPPYPRVKTVFVDTSVIFEVFRLDFKGLLKYLEGKGSEEQAEKEVNREINVRRRRCRRLG